MTLKEVTVGKYFRAAGGNAKFIRDYMATHPGPYPVYSASVVSPFGVTDEYEYDGHYLTWVMNGYGGRMQEINGKFSVNRDRGVLIPREGVAIPDLTYLHYVIEPRLMERAVGRRVDGGKNEYTKIYPETAESTIFQLLATSDGELDYKRMSELGDRLRRIRSAQELVSAAREPLARAVFPVDVPEPNISITLGDSRYFSLSIGKRVLRENHIEKGVPVYSANALTPFGSVKESNLSDFSRPSLLWGIDGIFDWNFIDKGVAFATTDHCGRLQTSSPHVDLEYVYQYLRSTRESYGFDRVFRASLANIKTEVCVVFPLDNEGAFCLRTQRELAMSVQRRHRARRVSMASLDDVLQSRLLLDER